MRLAVALVAVAVAISVAVAAVLVSRGRGEQTEPVVVDERTGTLEGVRLGDSVQDVRALRGAPTDTAQGFFPEGESYTGPGSIPNPRSDPGVRPTPLHYDDSAYLVSPTVGVYAMATLADAARTRAGVGVGDDLALVRERYDRVVCGEAYAGESLLGGEARTRPWCQATVGAIGVYFGGDPIDSITLLAKAPRRRR